MAVVGAWGNYCGIGMVACCFRRGHTNEPETTEPPVILDTTNMGNECVIVKSGKRICGTGAALATVPIMQDKCYFEMKIQSQGTWAIGVATKMCNLSNLPLGADATSWVLRSDGALCHNSVSRDNINIVPSEGDILGCSFDHVEVNFFMNGKNLHCPLTGMKGTVFPVVSVDDGCIIDVNFDTFIYPPPSGFQKLMLEKNLL